MAVALPPFEKTVTKTPVPTAWVVFPEIVAVAKSREHTERDFYLEWSSQLPLYRARKDSGFGAL
jgi:hypothetical protein